VTTRLASSATIARITTMTKIAAKTLAMEDAFQRYFGE
jgi:hypothetical protein